MPTSTTLRASSGALADEFDVALLDLDGVIYVGPDAVPHAAQSLAAARARGMRLAFVTNNAARPPAAVADHLTELGVAADPDEIITSAQAAAHYLADRLPSGAKVLVVGTTGLYEALRERGLCPVSSADDEPAAVVQGYSPDLDWAQLAEGAVAIRRGAFWVATNLDPTVPSPRGPLPGNGSLVTALRHATGATPTVTGKPEPSMHRETVERSGARRPIVVGDRLDTDIEGARAVGCPSLLVLTGVTTPTELLTAGPQHRPDYLAPDLRGLLRPHPPTEVHADGMAVCGGWSARLQGSVLRLDEPAAASTSAGHAAGCDARHADDLDPLRALCSAAWSASDGGSASATPLGWRIEAHGSRAEAALESFAIS